jgi:hypothetical protein
MEPVARVERSETRGRLARVDQPSPDFAEFIIGPAEGRTRWLNPGYTPPLIAAIKFETPGPPLPTLSQRPANKSGRGVPGHRDATRFLRQC